jgi:Fe-S-cluster containining protein
MSPCETCLIDEKLMLCCGRLPMSGERAPLVIAPGRTVMACPNLNADGRCSIYDARPQGCRIFFCDAYVSEEKSFYNSE